MRKVGIAIAFLGLFFAVGLGIAISGDDDTKREDETRPKVVRVTGTGVPTAVAVPPPTPTLMPGMTPMPTAAAVPYSPPSPTLAPGQTARPGVGGVEAPGTYPSSGGIGGSGPAAGGAQSGGGSYVSSLPNVADRKIIRNATLVVEVEDVSDTVKIIETRVQTSGGFVASSNMTIEATAQTAGPSATPLPQRERAVITIRVPSAAYPAVMNDMRALGNVKSEASDTSEVTEEYTDLQARLRNLQASEARYLELLDQATTNPDILTVQDRLYYVRLEIEQVTGRLQLLDDLTALATITITLELPPLPSVEERPSPTPSPTPVPAQPGWADGAWSDAWGESQSVLETMGVAAITASVILIWVLVPAALLGIGWRVFSLFSRRRQTQ